MADIDRIGSMTQACSTLLHALSVLGRSSSRSTLRLKSLRDSKA